MSQNGLVLLHETAARQEGVTTSFLSLKADVV